MSPLVTFVIKHPLNLMRKILIADAGSTKIDWALISDAGDIMGRFATDGLNALLAEMEDAEALMRNVRGQLGEHIPDEIHYYGAGCATERICGKMAEALERIGGTPAVSVSSDLLGAARALFGRESGIACILGTGSNSCLYDGEKIACNVPSLGYVLGDEGSGAALGKRLVRDAFKGQLPQTVREKFLDTYQLTLGDILDKVYRSPAPNKFLASLVPFLSDNLWNPYVYSLVLEELTSFIKRNVAMYDGAHSLPVSFTGSIASVFGKLLREAASSQGYHVSDIVGSPIEGLIQYHMTRPAI